MGAGGSCGAAARAFSGAGGAGPGPATTPTPAAAPPLPPAPTPAPPAPAPPAPAPVKKAAHFYHNGDYPIKVILATVGGQQENALQAQNAYRVTGFMLRHGRLTMVAPA